MRFFLLSSLLILCVACAPALYPNLKEVEGNAVCTTNLKPRFKADWYNATVDVMGHHISGLLLFKAMPDSSLRVVFTNEVGVTFFDFEFTPIGGFSVKQVFSKFNRKIIITLLRKDFELIVMQHADASLKSFTQNNEIFYAHAGKKETDYFITDKDCASLLRIEKVSKRKKMVETKFYGQLPKAPDSVYLKHFTFDMQIALKKIER